MSKWQLDDQIPLCLRIVTPKQVDGWVRLKGMKRERTRALGLDVYVKACCNTNWLLPHQIACTLLASTTSKAASKTACVFCELCRSWCVWLVAISMQPYLLPFSFFSWVTLLSWHPSFSFLPFHCVWHLCFHVLGPLLFLFMLHTPAPFPCQFTCLLAFLACAHHPCPISVKGFQQNGRKDQALCPVFCPLPEALLSASFCLCAWLSLFFCVSVPCFLG